MADATRRATSLAVQSQDFEDRFTKKDIAQARKARGPFCIYVYVEATTKADERFCAASPWVRPGSLKRPRLTNSGFDDRICQGGGALRGRRHTARHLPGRPVPGLQGRFHQQGHSTGAEGAVKATTTADEWFCAASPWVHVLLREMAPAIEPPGSLKRPRLGNSGFDDRKLPRRWRVAWPTPRGAPRTSVLQVGCVDGFEGFGFKNVVSLAVGSNYGEELP